MACMSTFTIMSEFKRTGRATGSERNMTKCLAHPAGAQPATRPMLDDNDNGLLILSVDLPIFNYPSTPTVKV